MVSLLGPSQRQRLVGWCFWLNGPLRQYFSLYQTVSQREGERKEKRKRREKMSKQSPTAPTSSAVDPCPTLIRLDAPALEVYSAASPHPDADG